MSPPGLVDWSTRIRIVSPGTHTIVGRAWSGAGARIQRVELGLDGEYRDAVLTQSAHRYGWSQWAAEIDITEGNHCLSCRATDESGAVQPDAPVSDYTGMGNNSVQVVPLVCDGAAFN